MDYLYMNKAWYRGGNGFWRCRYGHLKHNHISGKCVKCGKSSNNMTQNPWIGLLCPACDRAIQEQEEPKPFCSVLFSSRNNRETRLQEIRGASVSMLAAELDKQVRKRTKFRPVWRRDPSFVLEGYYEVEEIQTVFFLKGVTCKQ